MVTATGGFLADSLARANRPEAAVEITEEWQSTGNGWVGAEPANAEQIVQ
jgi:hypothetical protein